MKYMMTALVCGLLALALIGCHHSGSSSPASSVPAASSRLADTASSSIRIQLTRVEQQLTAVDGQVLVEYGYDRPIVSISGNATAQNAIQPIWTPPFKPSWYTTPRRNCFPLPMRHISRMI